MRLHRFYMPEEMLEEGKKVLLTASISHQLKNVFRIKINQEILLFNGNGNDFLATIINSEKSELTALVTKMMDERNENKREVVLYQSLIKKDHFELVAEKVTEIGVSKIVPVVSERSEKKSLNSERLNKILIEATEQSFRNKPPVLSEIVSFSSVQAFTEKTKAIIFHPEGKPFHSFIDELQFEENKNKTFSQFSVSLFIGPEGGWSDQEIVSLKEKGAEVVSLGSTILRSETAAISAAALLLL